MGARFAGYLVVDAEFAAAPFLHAAGRAGVPVVPRLPNFPPRQVGSLSLCHKAKSRWEIENQGFQDAKNCYGIEHVCHHHANSILLDRLLTLLAMVIERLYRLR